MRSTGEDLPEITGFLAAVLENLAEGVVACDANGILTTFNRATREFHGMPETSIHADEWAQSYHLFHADGVTPLGKADVPLFRALSGEIVKNVEMVIKAPDYTRIVQCSGQAIFDSNGKKLGAVIAMHDITEMKRSSKALEALQKDLETRVSTRTKELNESEIRFRTLFEQSPLSVQLLSPNGKTIQVNSAWKELWGVSDEVLNDFILTKYNMLEDQQLIDRGIMPIIEAGFRGKSGKIPAIFYDTASISDTKGRWVEAYIHPILDESQTVREVVIIHQDVTDKIRFENELKNARDLAEETSRLKSSFLANMSHEIRTPLSAILGFTAMLRDKNLDPASFEKYLNIIERSGSALSQIIDDILDLSKVEAGRLVIEKKAVNVSALIEEIITLLKIQSLKKNLTIDYPKTGEDLHLFTDDIRLRQILINIIGNAIKFTMAGTIQVEIKEHKQSDKMLEISVKDSGIGISAADQNTLFEPFNQIDHNRSRQFGGTGLGLALSKRLAQALGGDVRLAKSSVDKGSEFIISLPNSREGLVSVSAPESGKQGEVKISNDITGLKVLVVDDSDDNRFLLKTILSKKGAKITEAENGALGVQKALSEQFDIVLMDIQMPVMDGFEAIELLRKSEYTGPIIALTAHAMKEERDRCISAGADAHLSKPIDNQKLISLILTLT